MPSADLAYAARRTATPRCMAWQCTKTPAQIQVCSSARAMRCLSLTQAPGEKHRQRPGILVVHTAVSSSRATRAPKMSGIDIGDLQVGLEEDFMHWKLEVSSAICLRTRSAIPGTDIAYAAICLRRRCPTDLAYAPVCLRARNAKSGTDIAYGTRLLPA
eukprot:3180005-Rhodomonas_salina.2